MISAIILAAGESKRMGQPKMLLLWKKNTVLGHVISVFRRAGIEDILVVTGGAKELVEELAKACGARTVFNERYKNGEMLESIQVGLGAMKPEAQATLIGLGDQPQVEERSVRLVCEAFLKNGSDLVVPSYRMRRGHPWLIARLLWSEFLKMKSPQTPRDFLNHHADAIEYVEAESSSIIEDLDSPEDYLKFKP